MTVDETIQAAIVARLKSFPGVTAIIGDAVYDYRPEGGPTNCIAFGPSDAFDDSAECISGGVERMQLDVYLDAGGQLAPCKALCRQIVKALDDYDVDLAAPFALVSMTAQNFRVFLDPNGRTARGVVNVETHFEESE